MVMMLGWRPPRAWIPVRLATLYWWLVVIFLIVVVMRVIGAFGSLGEDHCSRRA
jgi:hypothetical protein